jgi:hypothetical protein
VYLTLHELPHIVLRNLFSLCRNGSSFAVLKYWTSPEIELRIYLTTSIAGFYIFNSVGVDPHIKVFIPHAVSLSYGISNSIC